MSNSIPLSVLIYLAHIQPTRLYATKNQVAKENNKKLDELQTQGRQYQAPPLDCKSLSVENLTGSQVKTVEKFFPVPSTLNLKIGAQVVLQRRLPKSRIHVNGSRGVVVGFHSSGYPTVLFRDNSRRVVRPADFSFQLEVNSTLHEFVYRQVPLNLAWSLTIHKCQGMSLDCAIVDLNNIFTAGQAYTAISRVRSLDGLQIINFDKSKFTVHPLVLQFYQQGMDVTGIPVWDYSND